MITARPNPFVFLVLIVLVLIWGVIMLAITFAQQLPDASKLAPIYQQQRNAEADGRAQCYAIVIELQAKIADLEKQLAEAKK